MRLALAPKMAVVEEDTVVAAEEAKAVIEEVPVVVAEEDQGVAVASDHRHSTYMIMII